MGPYFIQLVFESKIVFVNEVFRLTAIKNHVIKYCITVYERNGKKKIGLLKIQVKFLIN